MTTQNEDGSTKLPGGYIGTELDGKWWRRYKENGFFMRGSGEGALRKDGVSFHRHLTKDPLIIPYKNITDVTFGKWHAGKWLAGKPVLKLHWKMDGDPRELCSGFYFRLSEDRLQEMAALIRNQASL